MMSKPEAPVAGRRIGQQGMSLTVTTVNPSTGAALATYDETTPAAVEAILDRAHAASA
jgi:acyl-CoA reductase-like NAD-dependent aldehyde dehydrogenase